MSQYISLAAPDPKFLEILSTLPKDELQVTDIIQMRQSIIDGAIKPQQEFLRPHLPPGALLTFLGFLRPCTNVHIADTAYAVKDTQVPVDGGEILVRILIPTPAGKSGELFPLLVWYHASGRSFHPSTL